MATSSLGRLTLDLLVKLSSFEQGMNAAERKTKQTTDNMNKAVKGFKDQISSALSGTQIGSLVDSFNSKIGSLSGGFAVASAAAAGMAIGGVAIAMTGLSAMAIELAKNNLELANFAAVANTSLEKFQGLSGAAASFGITQEKLSDQLKDFNEKIGEFASVGSGGAKDFFEQIAVKTEGGAAGAKKLAEEMSKMDGITALQTYVDKLEEAGVNQQQMSFYLESMGSDLTALAPLLANGGQLWKDYQVAMEEAGIITGQEAIEKSIELTAQTESVQMQFTSLKNQLAQAVMPALSSVIGYFLEGSGKGGQFAGIVDAVGVAAKGTAVLVLGLAGGVKNLVTIIGGALKAIGNLGQTAVEFWNAPTLLDKGKSLLNGFQRNSLIVEDTAKSVWGTSKNTIGKMSGVIDGQVGSFDKLTQSIINNKKAQLEYNKTLGKGVTTGIAQNKALNPTAKAAKTPKGKKDNSAKAAADKAKREQGQIEKAQQSIMESYLTEREKLQYQHKEKLKKIREAFAGNKDAIEKYTKLENAAHDKSVKDFNEKEDEKTKKQEDELIKRYQSLSSAAAKMSEVGLYSAMDNLRNSDPNSYDRWELQNQYSDDVGQANDALSSGIEAVEDDPVLTEQQKNEQIESLRAQHYKTLEDLNKNYATSERQLRYQQNNATLAGVTSLMGAMLGEQSKGYQAMFAVQQAYAFATTLMSGYEAIALAWASAPFPYNLPAVISTTVSTGVLAAGVSAVQAVGFATGGHITGPGTGTSDDIPIMASNGEFMMRAAAVQGLGVGTMNYINQYGKLPPAYATGGLISSEKYLSNSSIPEPSSQSSEVSEIQKSGDTYHMSASFIDTRGADRWLKKNGKALASGLKDYNRNFGSVK